MKHITIDLGNVKNKNELHKLLKEELCLPCYYGKNLDALYDCLTSCGEELDITVEGSMAGECASYGEAFKATLLDVQNETTRITVTLL